MKQNKDVHPTFKNILKSIDRPIKQKQIIKNYAHDYRDIVMSQDELEKMLENFDKENKEEIEDGLEYIRQCATGEIFPYWTKEERIDLIIEELDKIKTKL